MAIYPGDLFDVLPTLPAESIDACVTDPPYGIGFMGKEWDTFKPGSGKTRKLMHPREREAAKIVSENPNIHGRHRSPALSPSQIDYDYSLVGLRGFQAWCEQWGREVFRVLKPGAYIVSCGAPRAYHRMASGLEDAGFEIRDCLAWLFLSGFPKSLNFGCKCGGNSLPSDHDNEAESAPECDVRRVRDTDVSAAIYAGDQRGQVLLEGLSEHGVSAYRETVSVGVDDRRKQPVVEGRELHRAGEGLPDGSDAGASSRAGERLRARAHRGSGADSRTAVEAERGSASQGSGSGEQRSDEPARLRFPSGTLDGGASERGTRCARCGGLTAAEGLGTALKPSHEPILLARKPFKGSVTDNYIKHGTGGLDISGCRIPSGPDHAAKCASVVGLDSNRNGSCYGEWSGKRGDSYNSLGRWPANIVIERGLAPLLEPYFYCPKPSREERDMGCYDLPARTAGEATDRTEGSAGLQNPRAGAGRTGGARNIHPTVKPVELMRWLVKLVTPIGGTVLDPFTGSGTTGMACRYELRAFIGIEREADYIDIAERRIASVAPLFAEEAR